MYIKRGLFWLWDRAWPVLQIIGKFYNDTLGFWFYKITFFLRRRIARLIEPWREDIVDVFGKRSTLQFVVLLVAVVVLIPHTKLYSQDTASIPGRKTLLYEMIGPGEFDFDIEEVEIDITTLSKQDERTWTQGSVVSPQVSTGAQDDIVVPQEIASISAGGTAISKPTIISGDAVATIPAGQTAPSSDRSKVVTHVVSAGDTIGAIAESYGISVETILWANNLSVRSYIRPGDSLKILPSTGVLHKVKRGETLSKIAKTYGAKTEDIIEKNKLQNDGSDIVIGEQLIIPGGRRPQPVRRVASTRRYTSLSNVAAPPPSVAAPAGSGYLWPTNVRRITQYYGWRHTGLDVAGPLGSPIYASRAGRVIKSQCGWNGGYGCHIVIDHGGVQTLYAHNSRNYVKVGQQVSQGQTIALMGSTGRSTGSHIHYEIRVNGRRQNPLRYIR